MKTNKSSERATQADRFSLIEVSDIEAASIDGGIAIAVRAESSAAGDTALVSIDPATSVELQSFDSALGNNQEATATQPIAPTDVNIRSSNRTFGFIKRCYFKERFRSLGRGFSFTID